MEKILLVEDSQLFQNLIINRINENLHEEVVRAGSLAEAQAAVEDPEADFSLAIVDLCLTDAPDGEAVDYLLGKGIPVIVVTSDFKDETYDKIIRKPIVDYILKRTEKDFDYLIHSIRRFRKNKGIKIMVVDDSGIYRDTVAAILNAQLFQVILAVDGQDALENLEVNPDIRLIITDNVMPRMDGHEFLDQVRKLYPKEKMAVLVLASFNDNRSIPRFLKTGANDFLLKPFNKEELLSRISGMLEQMDMSENLKEMVVRDTMTGLYNRKYFETGSVILGNARRNNENLAVALLDIDNFKRINDTYGHAAGDFYIVNLVRYLEEHFHRDSDIVARIGGDEFAVISSYENREQLVQFYQALSTGIASEEIAYRDIPVKLTASIGLTTILRDSVDEMLKGADNLLYLSKGGGKNRLSFE